MVDVSSVSLPYIKEETMLKSYTLFKEGDVAFADASEDTNDVAKAIEVINCNGWKIQCKLPPKTKAILPP